MKNWRTFTNEGVTDLFKSKTQKRRGNAEVFFNATPETLRYLILSWVGEALPKSDLPKYHPQGDITAGSEFAKADAQRYISQYLPNSPIEQMVNIAGTGTEGEDWASVGLDNQEYDAFLSYDTLIQTIKSMYEDSRMDILHNDLMRVGDYRYPGGVVHYCLLYLGKGIISSKRRYERKKT